MNKRIMFGLVLFMLVMPIVYSETIVHIKNVGALNGTDTVLSEELPSTSFETYGTLYMGTAGTDDRHRGLLNLSFVKKSIPSGVTINWLKIEFYGDQAYNGMLIKDVCFYPVKTSWVETVTWNGFNGGGVNMTDYNGTQNLASYSPANPLQDTYFNVTLDNTYSQNFFDDNLGDWGNGLILFHNVAEADGGTNDKVKFSSSDHATASERWSLWISYSEAPPSDTTSPTLDGTAINNTSPKINEVVNPSCKFTDETALSSIYIAHNLSGTWNNFSSVNYTGTVLSGNFSPNVTNTLGRANFVSFKCTANDTSGNVLQSKIFNYTVADTVITLSNGINITTELKVGSVVNLSGNITEPDVEIDFGCIIDNQTGSDTKTCYDLSGTKANFSKAITITATRGTVINFTSFVNDSINTHIQSSFILIVNNSIPATPNIINTTGKRWNTNITINITPSTDADGDTVTYFWFRNTTANPTPTLLQSGITLTSWTTTILTGEGAYHYFVNVSDGEVNVTGDMWDWTLDTTVPVLSDNITNYNNTYLNHNITVRVTATDTHIYNLTMNLTNGTHTFEFYHNSSPTGNELKIIKIPDLTNLKDGAYSLIFESVDSYCIPIDEDKLKKGKKGETQLIFNDTTLNKEINMLISFVEKSDKVTDTPADLKLYSDYMANGRVGFGINFTVLKPQTKPIFTITTNVGDMKIINDGIKGHLMTKPYGLDFEGTLLVNGIEKSYMVDVTRINVSVVEVKLIPDTELAGNDVIIFMSKTLFGLNLVTKTYTLNVVNTPPTCVLANITPHINLINASTRGYLNILLNCTSYFGINESRYFIIKTVKGSQETSLPYYHSIRPPSNNRAQEYTGWGHILKADGRGENKWYDNYLMSNDSYIFRDNSSYAVQDNRSDFVEIIMHGNSSILNFTRLIETDLFRSSVTLSRGRSEKARKLNFSVYKKNSILREMYNLEAILGSKNYTICAFKNVWGKGSAYTLDFRYCNSSFNKSAGVEVEDSPYCVYMGNYQNADVLPNKAIYTTRNSTYIERCFRVTDGKIGGIGATGKNYIHLSSAEPALSKAYQITYAVGSSNTNVTFNQTNTSFTTTDDITWTELQGMFDFHIETMKDNDIPTIGVYVEDLAGNSYVNYSLLELNLKSIVDIDYPISAPNIQRYYTGICPNETGCSQDNDKNGTYRSYMTIHVNMGKDPNGVGTVNHTLYLVNATVPFNVIYVINLSFNSTDDNDVHVYFNTSNVVDGQYRMNISAQALDDDNDYESRLTITNFTIDNTYPTLSLNSPADSSTLYSATIPFSWTSTDSNFKNCSLYVSNSLLYTSTSSGSQSYSWESQQISGNYNWYVRCYDSTGNVNTSTTRSFTISVPRRLSGSSGGGGGSGSGDSVTTDKKCEVELNPNPIYLASDSKFANLYIENKANYVITTEFILKDDFNITLPQTELEIPNSLTNIYKITYTGGLIEESINTILTVKVLDSNKKVCNEKEIDILLLPSISLIENKKFALNTYFNKTKSIFDDLLSKTVIENTGLGFSIFGKYNLNNVDIKLWHLVIVISFISLLVFMIPIGLLWRVVIYLTIIITSTIGLRFL